VATVSHVASDIEILDVRSAVIPEISGSLVDPIPLLVDDLEEGVLVVDDASAQI
jgi:hypothetical protein